MLVRTTNFSNATCAKIPGSEELLFFTSIISLLCSLLVLLLFCRYRRLRSHLSQIIGKRIGWDFILALLFTLNLDLITDKNLCVQNSVWSSLLVFLVQTSFISAECWYLCAAIDPVLSILRPFLSNSFKRTMYSVFVGFFAILSGFLLIVITPTEH